MNYFCVGKFLRILIHSRENTVRILFICNVARSFFSLSLSVQIICVTSSPITFLAHCKVSYWKVINGPGAQIHFVLQFRTRNPGIFGGSASGSFSGVAVRVFCPDPKSLYSDQTFSPLYFFFFYCSPRDAGTFPTSHSPHT